MFLESQRRDFSKLSGSAEFPTYVKLWEKSGSSAAVLKWSSKTQFGSLGLLDRESEFMMGFFHLCLWKKPGGPAEQIHNRKGSEDQRIMEPLPGLTGLTGCGAPSRKIWMFNSTESQDLRGVCEKVEDESRKGNLSLAQFGPVWTCIWSSVVGGGCGNLSLWSHVAQKTETGQKIKD